MVALRGCKLKSNLAAQNAFCLITFTTPMKKIVTVFLWLILHGSTLFSQQFRALEQSHTADSSYYDIQRLANGEIWMGGEYGILKRLQGQQLQTLSYPAPGSNILKIAESGPFVFVAGDEGHVYRYDTRSGQWKGQQYSAFRDLCFYDMALDASGNLVLCGGTSGIGKGKMRIPRGFVVRIDSSLNHAPELVWENTRKFAWALCNDGDGRLAVSIFNGLNTQIYRLDAQGELVPGERVKGLVHSLYLENNRLLYAGCPTLFYKKHGLWGYTDDRTSRREIPNSGFITALVMHNGQRLALSQKGMVLRLRDEGHDVVWRGEQGAVYEGISDGNRLFIAGHGKSLLVLTQALKAIE